MRHLIQRQEFRFTTPFLQVQEWERRVNELLQRVITPAIEDCFDKASSDSSYHIIDRLEIDLGKIHKDISEQKIRDLVTIQLTERLRSVSYKINKENTGHNNNRENNNFNTTANQSINSDQKQYRKEEDAHASIYDKQQDADHIISSSQANIKCLIYFLLNGRLPWWAEPHSFQIKKEWLEQATEEELLLIKQVLSESEQARQRLARQSGIDFITALLRRLDPDDFFAAIAAWQWLETSSTVTSGYDLRILSYEYWLYWINKIAGIQKETARLQKAIEQTTHFSTMTRIVQHIQQSGAGLDESVKEIIIQTCKDIFEITITGEQVFKEENKAISESDVITNQKEHQPVSPGQELLSIAKKLIQPEQMKADKKDQTNPGPDELFAEDAGLVLVHPFLQELFTGFDLLDANKQWRSSTAQQTAVWLLVWLAHGETNIPEYRLLVPKLFCGMLWEDVLDTSIVLTEEHIRSSTEMLEAVIKHWKTIGNTSPDGLREGFINRSGKIATTKDGWQITVEKKAQDILLGRLPWGLSMIHFPWLDNRFIHVDWA